MAFLKVIKGSCPGQILEVGGERMVIGRHPNCEIVLDNAAVSRHHAQLLQSHGNYYLEDLRSRNRTYLNGEAISGRTELNDGDKLKVCDVVFSFHLKIPSAPESPPRTESTITSVAGRAGAALRDAGPLTPDEMPVVVDDELPAGSVEASSIVSTLDAKPESSSLRVTVKPETKLGAVLEISRSLARTLNIREVLGRALEGLFHLFPQADEGFVLLEEPETKKLAVKAIRSRRPRDGDSVRVSTTIVRKAMETCEAILSHDALQDSRFEKSDSLSQLQIRSMMCVPILAQDEQALGVIQIDTKDLQHQFSQDDLDTLVSVASPVSLAVENAYLHETVLKQRDRERERERELRDLDIAMQVQLSFLPPPDKRPRLPGYEFTDFYEAALHVGGDYFDYIDLTDGRVAVALGDVAGKGVPAALLMARLSSSARFYLLTRPTLAGALAGLNAEIASSGLGHRFVSFAVLVLDPRTHEIVVGNAGHLPPLLRKANGKTVELGMKETGMPLGVVREQEFEEVRVALGRGESVTLYTDGVTEAMNDADAIYGRARLARCVSNGPAEPEELVGSVIRDVEEFSQGRQQRDDVCLVCFRRIE